MNYEDMKNNKVRLYRNRRVLLGLIQRMNDWNTRTFAKRIGVTAAEMSRYLNGETRWMPVSNYHKAMQQLPQAFREDVLSIDDLPKFSEHESWRIRHVLMGMDSERESFDDTAHIAELIAKTKGHG